MGTFLIFYELGLGLPTLREWHHLYRLNSYEEGLYYITKWSGEEATSSD